MSTLRIGITGGIGSGKSYVAQRLCSRFGLRLYDSDARAKALMVSAPELRQRLTALLGDDAYRPDGSLDRAYVARRIFADADLNGAINAIVHPAVRDDWRRFAEEDVRPALLESALFVEAGLIGEVDKLIVVTAPEALRLQRAMARDGATADQIRARMARQLPEADLLAHADIVVVNDGRPIGPQLAPLARTLRETN